MLLRQLIIYLMMGIRNKVQQAEHCISTNVTNSKKASSSRHAGDLDVLRLDHFSWYPDDHT